MAIVRFGTDSDVYVYCGEKGYVCCGCRLDGCDGEFIGADEAAMLAHLSQHRAAGHKVPDAAFETLRGGADRTRKYLFWAKIQMVLAIGLTLAGLIGYLVYFLTSPDQGLPMDDLVDVFFVVVLLAPLAFLAWRAMSVSRDR